MGGCATKPRELKTEAEAPVPLEVQRTAADTKAGAAGEEKDELQQGGERTEKVAEEGIARATEENAQPDEKRRRSLGLLFREDEEINVSSQEDNVVVKETIASSTVEAKDAVQQPKTGEHPVESLPRTLESGIFNTTQEEASVPSDSATSLKP